MNEQSDETLLTIHWLEGKVSVQAVALKDLTDTEFDVWKEDRGMESHCRLSLEL